MSDHPPAHQWPTVFHVTHWKAGSIWLRNIFLGLSPERLVPLQIDNAQFLRSPLVDGGIYSPLYVTKDEFQSVFLPANYRIFVVIRDLRDTLVSGYFSMLYSHPVVDARIVRWRRMLQSMPIEDGLLMLLDEWLPLSARIQESWIDTDVQIVRYEELLENDVAILEDLLIGEWRVPLSTENLRAIVLRERFDNVTRGRMRGNEDIFAHERKGIAGDWQNHFTPVVTEKMLERHQELLIRTGYIQPSRGMCLR
jgi:hypothetical protein